MSWWNLPIKRNESSFVYSITRELENSERKKIQSSSEPFERERILFVETLSSVVFGVLGSLGCISLVFIVKDLDLSSPVDVGQVGAEPLKFLYLFW